LIRSRIVDDNSIASQCLAVYLGMGDGSFQDPMITASGTSFSTVRTADLTGDGRPEIIAYSSSGYGIYSFDTDIEQLVLLRSIPIVNGHQASLFADVTGDGVFDFVLFQGATAPVVAWDATMGLN